MPIRTTTGFFEVMRSTSRQIRSEASASPPGESTCSSTAPTRRFRSAPLSAATTDSLPARSPPRKGTGTGTRRLLPREIAPFTCTSATLRRARLRYGVLRDLFAARHSAMRGLFSPSPSLPGNSSS